MTKSLFNRFIKDHLLYTIIFFMSNLLIILFYYLALGSSIEWLYPVAIMMFMYSIFITYKYITYKSFNNKIHKLASNMNFNVKAYSFQEKEVIKLFTSIHQHYLQQIMDLSTQDKTNKHILSQWIHDMKTPVSIVDLILQKTLKDEIPLNKALKDINEENYKLLNKLDQVLSIIRLEDFSEDYVPEVVDLTATIRQVINEKRNQFIYNKVYPKLDENEQIKVLTDEKWNKAMIDQIIGNAIKYSNAKDSSKNIYFTFKRIEDKVILAIRDEGIGIPDYDLNRVFNLYFTGDNGRAFNKSTGIGLYFCSQVAKKLGHKVQVKSKVGEGTEIMITYLAKL